MGFMTPEQDQRFTLADLGIVHGPSDPILKKCVSLAEQVFPQGSAIIAFRDGEGRRAIIQARGPNADIRCQKGQFLLQGSLTEKVCGLDRQMSSMSGNEAHWSAAMPELAAFFARGFIAAPIHGPADEPVGMLACLTPRPADWTPDCIGAIESLATLASQRIMLKAALRTVRLISRETPSLEGFVAVRRH